MGLTVKEVRLALMAAPDEMEVWIESSNEKEINQTVCNSLLISPEKGKIIFRKDEEE